MKKSISERIEAWYKGLEEEIRMDERDMEELEKYLAAQLDIAESSAESDPSGSYARMVKLASVSGHLAQRKPALVELLTKYLKRFIAIMDKIKKALGAVSFSISVSFPFYISFSITF